jgi:hypothetical protein
MANEVIPGPIAQHVIDNVRRLRTDARLSFTSLSVKLAAVGHPILSTGLQRLEAGKRRVDPDDLIALAIVFDVTPITLLLPSDERGTMKVTESMTVSTNDAWFWARGKRPLAGGDDSTWTAFRARSLPPSHREYRMDTDEGRLAFARDHPDQMVNQVKGLLAQLEVNSGGERPEEA